MMTHPVAPTPDPSRAISPPAIAGPMTRPRLNDAELRPTAFGKLVAPHHLVDERLAGRCVDRGADAEQEGDHVDVPDRPPNR